MVLPVTVVVRRLLVVDLGPPPGPLEGHHPVVEHGNRHGEIGAPFSAQEEAVAVLDIFVILQDGLRVAFPGDGMLRAVAFVQAVGLIHIQEQSVVRILFHDLVQFPADLVLHRRRAGVRAELVGIGAAVGLARRQAVEFSREHTMLQAQRTVPVIVIVNAVPGMQVRKELVPAGAIAQGADGVVIARLGIGGVIGIPQDEKLPDAGLLHLLQHAHIASGIPDIDVRGGQDSVDVRVTHHVLLERLHFALPPDIVAVLLALGHIAALREEVQHHFALVGKRSQRTHPHGLETHQAVLLDKVFEPGVEGRVEHNLVADLEGLVHHAFPRHGKTASTEVSHPFPALVGGVRHGKEHPFAVGFQDVEIFPVRPEGGRVGEFLERFLGRGVQPNFHGSALGADLHVQGDDPGQGGLDAAAGNLGFLDRELRRAFLLPLAGGAEVFDGKEGRVLVETHAEILGLQFQGVVRAGSENQERRSQKHSREMSHRNSGFSIGMRRSRNASCAVSPRYPVREDRACPSSHGRWPGCFPSGGNRP